MKKYFYIRDGRKMGPFTLEELQNEYITPETMVWHAGMEKWQPAEELEELRYYLQEPAPEMPGETRPAVELKPEKPVLPPKTWLVESILVTVFCCLPFGIVGIVQASRVESRFYSGDREGAERASKEAGRWTKLGFWLGLAFGIFYLAFMISMGVYVG